MARKIGGNLSTQRVLLGRRDVGISRTVRDCDVLLYDRLLVGQLDADCVAFFWHVVDNHTANSSVSGNKLTVAK